MVEYSVDAKLPDAVFEDPVLRKMFVALGDLGAWANVSEQTYFVS